MNHMATELEKAYETVCLHIASKQVNIKTKSAELGLPS